LTAEVSHGLAQVENTTFLCCYSISRPMHLLPRLGLVLLKLEGRWTSRGKRFRGSA
jgi:hypothetical protein